MRLANGSQTGLHGAVLDMAVLDEAWAYGDDRLEAAILPAMMTRSNPQTWIVCTQGIAGRSLYLDDQCDRGRQAVEAGVTEGVAYFEWSADPSADPADTETWRSCLPALGLTVAEEFVRDAQRSMPAHEFRRAFLNLQSSGVSDALIPLDRWMSLAEPDAPRPPWVALGVDVAPKGKSAAVAAAGERNGLMYGALLEHGPTTEWLLSALERLVVEVERPYVVIDGKACAHLRPEIEAVVGRDRLVTLSAREVPAACEFWLRLVNEDKLRHRGEKELTVALDGAGQRSLGDGWAWSRARSGTDITPLAALTWAVEFHRGGWRS